MTKKEYAEVLKRVIMAQIEYVEDEANNGACETEHMAMYYSGIKKGLQIALEKIDASMFLAEE